MLFSLSGKSVCIASCDNQKQVAETKSNMSFCSFGSDNTHLSDKNLENPKLPNVNYSNISKITHLVYSFISLSLRAEATSEVGPACWTASL